MKDPIFAICVVLIILTIASPPSSCTASRVLDAATSNPFDPFDYGAVVDQNSQSYYDSQEEAFPEIWRFGGTPRSQSDYVSQKKAFPGRRRSGATPNTFDVQNAQTKDDFQEAFLEAWGGQTNSFNVMDFGAVGNGQADDSNAFLKAWEAVCGSSTQGILTLVVPKGKTFLLNSVVFQGPCKAPNVNFQIQGNLVAPNSVDVWKNKKRWIQFTSVKGLIINGGGRIDGNGAVWWQACGKNCERPTSFHLNSCDDLQVSRLLFYNSPRNHISVSGCNGAQISGLVINAPKYSPNTDGIDISGSTNVAIHSSVIATGDDCIAINSGSSHINITGIKCGPGHGISIGSLGQHGAYSTVEEVYVSNCSIREAQNGLRIKTWEGGSGYAKKITFENISLTNSQNPIIIDQHYSTNPSSPMDQSEALQVSDVTYRNIDGSSADEIAIKLDCGGSSGCNNIVFENVVLRSNVPYKRASAYCKNAHGNSYDTVDPAVSCLLSQ